jgi:hypothetical protein
MRDERKNHLSSGNGKKYLSRSAKTTVLAAGLLVGLGVPGANALAQTVTVNCPGDSIQALLNLAPPAIKNGTMNINGTCTEDVLVTLDNATFNGSPGATISGTVTVDGARRVEFQNLKITGSGDGIVVTRNATVTVRGSDISQNDDNGIIVNKGAHAEVLNSFIIGNGQNPSDPEQGEGISVGDGGNARIVGNFITDNLAYGVDVYNDSFARLESNIIKRNGRLSLFETGLGVFRARVRANGNVYEDNGWAAMDIFNDASYRTGRGLNANTFPDNPFGFERIIAGTGQVAVSIGRGSNVDLRQVIVQGPIEISNDSLLHVRGDSVAPNTQCSEVDDITASGVNSTIQLIQFTRVNGTITADSNQGNRIASNSGCPLP